MSTSVVPIRFEVGSRPLLSVRRVLETCEYTLDDLVNGVAPEWPRLAPAADGMRFLSAPPAALDAIRDRYPRCVVGGLQRYDRHFIAMDGKSYAEYMQKFSSKTRSGFKRKRRRLSDAMAGDLQVREFRTAADVDRFVADAAPLSRRTYQARLLNAGLPTGPRALARMKMLAARDELRAYVMYGRGAAISYLYLPTTGGVIIYEHLGYDPDLAHLSVGTLLQLDAMERLFAESRYRFFDFTEGTGEHKAMFATGSVAACSFYLLGPGTGNRLLARMLNTFDGSVAAMKLLAARTGVLAPVRHRLRGHASARRE